MKYTDEAKKSYLKYYKEAKKRGDKKILSFGQHVGKNTVSLKRSAPSKKDYTTMRTDVVSSAAKKSGLTEKDLKKLRKGK